MHTNPEVLALLALGEDVALPAERQHVTTCPLCSEEVADLARIADVGRSSPASGALSAPSPEVWRRIAAEVGFDAPGGLPSEHRTTGAAKPETATVTELAPRLTHRSTAPARRGGWRRVGSVAIAAVLALVVGIGVGIAYERQVTQPVTRVIASASLNPLPAFPGASGTAEVTADGRGGRELIVRMTTPKPPTGTVHVWLMDAHGGATLMGQMENGVARLSITPGMSLFERPTIDISDEPSSNPHPAAPGGPSILRGVLV